LNSDQCPNLVEWSKSIILVCKSGDTPYVPELAELRQYCKNSNFHKCPALLNFEQLLSSSNILDIC
jgi:hypothetical protein